MKKLETMDLISAVVIACLEAFRSTLILKSNWTQMDKLAVLSTFHRVYGKLIIRQFIKCHFEKSERVVVKDYIQDVN